jgi:Polysaccharide pyruvyl transferase
VPSRFFIEGLGPELERETPVLWHAVGVPHDPTDEEAGRLRAALAARPYVSVRDEFSLKRLRDAGVDRDVAVVPDTAVLLPRLFPEDVLEKRLAHLRHVGSFPEGPALVVQGYRRLLPYVSELAASLRAALAARPDLRVVLIEIGPCHGDGELAAALATELGDAAVHAGGLGTVDVAAAIRGAEAFVGSSLHGNVAALVYGRPHLVLSLFGETKLEGFARLAEAPEVLVERPGDLPGALERTRAAGSRAEAVAALQARADSHFDRLAEIARDAGGAVEDGEATRRLLERGYRARGRELARLRWELADRIDRAERGEAEATALNARLLEEVAWLSGVNERLEAEQAEQARAFEEERAWLGGRAEEGERLALENERLALENERLAFENERRAFENERRAQEAEERVQRLLSSRSFRYTAPFRAVARWLRRLVRR